LPECRDRPLRAPDERALFRGQLFQLAIERDHRDKSGLEPEHLTAPQAQAEVTRLR